MTALLILQILFHSTEKQYFLTNLPWLIGSLGTLSESLETSLMRLGTIAEDFLIFLQFRLYSKNTEIASRAAA